MDEGEFCTIIKRSFQEQGEFLYKISDPSAKFSATIKRPFDLFGSLNKRAIAIEVKYSKGLKSFNLKSIEDHQIEALMDYKKSIPDAYTLIMLGVYAKRADYRVYVFSASDIEKRRLLGGNVLKKELEETPYLTCIKKEGKLYIMEDVKTLCCQ